MEGGEKRRGKLPRLLQTSSHGDVETENLTYENVDKEKGTAVYKQDSSNICVSY